MAESEIARFRQTQALQERAAQQGFSNLAAVASHASITARMELGAISLLQLIDEGKYQEVAMLMETTNWGQGA